MPPPTSASSARRRPPARVSGEQREGAIVATLEQLLAVRTLHEISVDDLARGAGISRPTFYFYFASKEAVLLTLLERLVEQAQHAVAEAPPLLADDPERAWRVALGTTYTMWSQHRGVIRAAAEARSSSPRIRALWSGLLERFVDDTTAAIEVERERGAAPPGIPARDLAVCLTRMNERIFETTLVEGESTLDEDRVLDSLLEVWWRAIYAAALPQG